MASIQRSQMDDGHLLEIAKRYERIVEIQPNDIQSMEILKEVYLNLHRDEDARGLSMRIAERCVLLGEVSSAILEYEGILQKFPDHPECLASLERLRGKIQPSSPRPQPEPATQATGERVEDENLKFLKFFVEHKLLNEVESQSIHADLVLAVRELKPDTPAPSLMEILSQRGIASLEKCMSLVVQHLRVPYIPLDLYDIDPQVVSYLEPSFCVKHLVLPLSQVSGTVMIAMVNPFDTAVRQEVEVKVEHRVQWYFTHPQDQARQLRRLFLKS